MSILDELYNGNINPSERYVRKGSEYQKISIHLCEYIDKLLPLLNNEEKELYETIREDTLELNCISERECFIDGFRIGAQMVWEIIHFKSANYF